MCFLCARARHCPALQLDDGGPLLALGAGPAADQVVGIAAPPTETCNSVKDPSVYTGARRDVAGRGPQGHAMARNAGGCLVNGCRAISTV